MLAGVAAKEFLAEVLANAVQDDVLAGLDLAFWDANRFEMRRRTGLVEIEILERIQRQPIDRQRCRRLRRAPDARRNANR